MFLYLRTEESVNWQSQFTEFMSASLADHDYLRYARCDSLAAISPHRNLSSECMLSFLLKGHIFHVKNVVQ